MKRDISLLAQVVKDIAESRNWQEKLERHRLFSFWDSVVGRDIASHARPKLLRGAVLWVDVTDSVWMQQLHFQKTEILESINMKLQGTVIEDIRFQLVCAFPVQHKVNMQSETHSPQLAAGLVSESDESNLPYGDSPWLAAGSFNLDSRESEASGGPDPGEELEFDQMASAVSDENIRKSMKKLWLAQKSRRK